MERWDRAGRRAAYGAALALLPYLVIKVSWVAGSLLRLAPVPEGYSLSGWVFLNTVTVGMTAIGIALALALVRPWGMRIPGRPVVFCAWTGAGFLVSILPYAVLTTLLDAGGGDPPDDGGDGAAMPGWVGALIQFGFVGMGLGLAVALPAYLRRRWPEAFAGRVGDGTRTALPWPAVAAAAVGLGWLYWAAGGTWGLARPDERGTDWRLLTGLGAGWALAGAAAALALARARPAGLPRWLPLAAGWLGSGSLFAWSGWKLPVTLVVALARPGGAAPPEAPAVAAVLHLAAVVAGAGLLRTLLRTDRSPAPAGTGDRSR
ncbi:hypothetical protein [Streptomyces aculeolatus]|uniref:hypothetical protein n=1 Tax=Streptomyces aculeolatus TaxID=270689 RepID=UPI001CED4A75|nr:hypothetical protein [Streptomyces aculeolatus]